MMNDENATYKKDIEGNEIYFTVKGAGEDLVIFPRGLFYAKTKDGDEYYPENGQIISRNYEPVYAVDRNGYVIFPKNANGDEYYLKRDNENPVLNSRGNMRYAKLANKREIYPTVKTDKGFFEMAMAPNYAKDENNNYYYPVDEEGNELFNKAIQELNRYPVTKNGFIIVPQVESKPYFIKNATPQVTLSNIVGSLQRPTGSIDYLTNIQSNRRPQMAKKENNSQKNAEKSGNTNNVESSSTKNDDEKNREPKLSQPPNPSKWKIWYNFIIYIVCIILSFVAVLWYIV